MHINSPKRTARRLRSNSTGIAIACAIVCVLSAVGSIAYAAIGTSGIINGSIRGIDIHNETIRGADVDNGSLGPQEFASGTADFTRAYTVGTTTTTPLENDADGALLISRSVPAGSYTFVVTVEAVNSDNQINNTMAVCEIDAAGTEIANGGVRLGQTDETNFGQMTILGSVRLYVTSVIELRCYGATTTEATNAKLVATKVGSLSKLGSYIDLY